MTYALNSTNDVAVAIEVFWLPTGPDTPRNCKLQLLGDGGVACYGNYCGEKFWVGWAPVPRRPNNWKTLISGTPVEVPADDKGGSS